MKKIIFITIVVIAALQLGCATEAGYKDLLRSWQGQPELELVRSWGPPQSVYENGGTRFLTYDRRSQIFIPGTNPTYQTTMIGNMAYTTPVGGSPSYNIPVSCRTTFEIVNERITNASFQGNHCVR